MDVQNRVSGTKVPAQFVEALRAGKGEPASADFEVLRRGFIADEYKLKSNIFQFREKSMTYWRLHYHIIWATFERQPSLTPEREKVFYGVLYKKGEELEVKIHAAGNTDDHVHLVVSIPPKLAVADFVRHIKGAASYAIHHMEKSDDQFEWQEGYGALTINERTLGNVMAYTARQKEHHKADTSLAAYERIDEDR